jgi:hypothetical protein
MNQLKTLTALIAVSVLGACANPATTSVPKNLEPAPDEMPAMVVSAKGVQIYECRVKAGSGEVDWVFVAPEADLYDVRGRSVGRHGAGPFWELADGSAVRASVKERAEAPIAGAIPWLLLAATKPYGVHGRLTNVTSIQRLNTTGGIAPASGCDRTTVGSPARVAYTADYVFFVR